MVTLAEEPERPLFTTTKAESDRAFAGIDQPISFRGRDGQVRSLVGLAAAIGHQLPDYVTYAELVDPLTFAAAADAASHRHLSLRDALLAQGVKAEAIDALTPQATQEPRPHGLAQRVRMRVQGAWAMPVDEYVAPPMPDDWEPETAPEPEPVAPPREAPGSRRMRTLRAAVRAGRFASIEEADAAIKHRDRRPIR